MISILLLFEYITRTSLIYLEDIELIANVNSIFHVLDFLKLFISFKYGF